MKIKFGNSGWIVLGLLFLVGLGISNTVITDTYIKQGDGRKLSPLSTCTVDASGYGDQTTIQGCINSLSNSTGGTVYIREGLYTITSPILLKQNTSLIGSGIDSTIIKASANVTFPGTRNAMIENDDEGSSPGDKNIRMSDFTLDVNIDNQATCDLVSGLYCNGIKMWYASDISIERVKVINFGGLGIGIYGSMTTGREAKAVVRDCIVERGLSSNVDASGIWISDVSSSGTRVINNRISDIRMSGIRFEASASLSEVVGNYIEKANYTGISVQSSKNDIISENIIMNVQGTGLGIYVADSYGITILSNTVNNTLSDSMRLSNSNHSRIIGNNFIDAGDSGDYGIFLVSSSNNNTIIGNNVRDTKATPTIDYGYYEANTGTGYNTVIGNVFTNIELGSVKEPLMEGTTFFGNIGYTKNILIGDLNITGSIQPSKTRPTATEGNCYWNTTATYNCLQCYNSTHWICGTNRV